MPSLWNDIQHKHNCYLYFLPLLHAYTHTNVHTLRVWLQDKPHPPILVLCSGKHGRYTHHIGSHSVLPRSLMMETRVSRIYAVLNCISEQHHNWDADLGQCHHENLKFPGLHTGFLFWSESLAPSKAFNTSSQCNSLRYIAASATNHTLAIQTHSLLTLLTELSQFPSC